MTPPSLLPRHATTSRWVLPYVAARLVASAFALVLTAWDGIEGTQIPMLLYGPVTAALAVALPALRRRPLAWLVDFVATLAFVVHSGDWRSPFYLLWLTALVLPAVSLPLVRALAIAVGAAAVYLLVAIIGGPAPGRLQLISTETLAIHVSLPLLMGSALAYAAEALRQLSDERGQRERLAIETERRRIAWELHDSAKQRIHAAHLLVSSLQGHVSGPARGIAARAAVELQSASSDMDTSLAELRSPLEGRRLDEALRARARELASSDGPSIEVRGTAPELDALVAAHAYRIACEALTNALRHADARVIEVELAAAREHLRLTIRDDGRGMPAERRDGATGIFAMQSRAASIGGRLAVAPAEHGGGTVVSLRVPLNQNGGEA